MERDLSKIRPERSKLVVTSRSSVVKLVSSVLMLLMMSRQDRGGVSERGDLRLRLLTRGSGEELTAELVAAKYRVRGILK